MSKSDWDDIVKEEVSEGLKARTMARVRQELEVCDRRRTFSLAWLLPIVPALGALLLYFRQGGPDAPVEGHQLAQEMEYLDQLATLTEEEWAQLDHDMIRDLSLLEELEVLEAWDGKTDV